MQQDESKSTTLTADSPPALVKARSIVYIDGFNLYFAVLRHFPEWKWLNLQSLFEEIRVDDEVVSVKYFTAMVEPKLFVSSTRDRQNLYLNALRTLPKIRIIQGAYQDRNVRCRGSCKEEYVVPEEKKTDVNIAVQMINDVLEGEVERLVIVSGDSDLEPAIKWVRQKHSAIAITVYIPSRDEEKKKRRNDYYPTIGVGTKFLPLTLLEKHQLPNPAPAKSGAGFQRPASWVKRTKLFAI